MSGEQLTAKELNKNSNINSFKKSKTSKVDINDLLYKVRTEKNKEKSHQNSQFSQKSVYVRDDDQDWGSSGMNDIQESSE